MCFSAGASFGACAILAVAGIASVKKVRTKNQLMFASIPLIFSVQQFSEGFVWLNLTGDYTGSGMVPMHVFLFFAQVLWPVWVPLSILLLDKNSPRKKGLKILSGLGAVLSMYLAYCLLSYGPTAVISSHHIHYNLDFPHQYISALGAFYFLPTIIPPFLSGIKKMTLLGILNLSSFVVSKIFFDNYVISVWCFFAAIMSAVIFVIMKYQKGTTVEPRLTDLISK